MLLRSRARDDARIWTAWSLYRLSRDPAAVAVVLDILRVTDPDQKFFYWNSGLIAVESFDLTPPVLVALLELVIRVKPNNFLIRQFRKMFGHRYLDSFDAPSQWKPREQRALARQIWRDLPEAKTQKELLEIAHVFQDREIDCNTVYGASIFTKKGLRDTGRALHDHHPAPARDPV